MRAAYGLDSENTEARQLGEQSFVSGAPGLLRQSGYLIEWQENLVGLYAYLLCLIGDRDGAC